MSTTGKCLLLLKVCVWMISKKLPNSSCRLVETTLYFFQTLIQEVFMGIFQCTGFSLAVILFRAINPFLLYTVFGSKCVIVNLYNSLTARPNVFKLSVYVGNDWRFCLIEPQYWRLEWLMSAKHGKNHHFWAKVVLKEIIFICMPFPNKLCKH